MEAARDPARAFQDSIVWRGAHEFVLDVYGLQGELRSRKPTV